eukprot:TRINITY_DN2245_c0_g1_i1.p1 TRINITY_DN2245_c0_g1~~TRINITY_DN2245_c0_g1_i1.p1  ORF type:complete len:263 (+),score=88.49 TRINITY_DN2245_c0_g1_i1:48-791(+)
METILDQGHVAIANVQKRVAAYGGREFEENGRGVVAVLAYILGTLGGCGLVVALTCTSFYDFGFWLFFVCAFHFSEFTLVALYNSKDLTANSFLINHSDPYTLAVIACLLEYAMEYSFLPAIKANWFVVYPGVLLTAAGFAVRVVAMVTAGHNFTHIVQDQKRENHELVTSGIYSKCRHPGYAGWFYFTIGLQVILGNPVCTPAFAYVSYKFFKDRIEDEETHLIEFFQEDYVKYRAAVPTLIPGIK